MQHWIEWQRHCAINRSHFPKTLCSTISFVLYSQRDKITGLENKSLVTRGWEGEEEIENRSILPDGPVLYPGWWWHLESVCYNSCNCTFFKKSLYCKAKYKWIMDSVQTALVCEQVDRKVESIYSTFQMLCLFCSYLLKCNLNSTIKWNCHLTLNNQGLYFITIFKFHYFQ